MSQTGSQMDRRSEGRVLWSPPALARPNLSPKRHLAVIHNPCRALQCRQCRNHPNLRLPPNPHLHPNPNPRLLLLLLLRRSRQKVVCRRVKSAQMNGTKLFASLYPNARTSKEIKSTSHRTSTGMNNSDGVPNLL